MMHDACNMNFLSLAAYNRSCQGTCSLFQHYVHKTISLNCSYDPKGSTSKNSCFLSVHHTHNLLQGIIILMHHLLPYTMFRDIGNRLFPLSHHLQVDMLLLLQSCINLSIIQCIKRLHTTKSNVGEKTVL